MISCVSHANQIWSENVHNFSTNGKLRPTIRYLRNKSSMFDGKCIWVQPVCGDWTADDMDDKWRMRLCRCFLYILQEFDIWFQYISLKNSFYTKISSSQYFESVQNNKNKLILCGKDFQILFRSRCWEILHIYRNDNLTVYYVILTFRNICCLTVSFAVWVTFSVHDLSKSRP